MKRRHLERPRRPGPVERAVRRLEAEERRRRDRSPWERLARALYHSDRITFADELTNRRRLRFERSVHAVASSLLGGPTVLAPAWSDPYLARVLIRARALAVNLAPVPTAAALARSLDQGRRRRA